MCMPQSDLRSRHAAASHQPSAAGSSASLDNALNNPSLGILLLPSAAAFRAQKLSHCALPPLAPSLAILSAVASCHPPARPPSRCCTAGPSPISSHFMAQAVRCNEELGALPLLKVIPGGAQPDGVGVAHNHHLQVGVVSQDTQGKADLQ